MAHEKLAVELSQNVYVEAALNTYTAYPTEAEAVSLIKTVLECAVLECAVPRLPVEDAEKVRKLEAQIAELNRQLDGAVASRSNTARLLFRSDLTPEVETLIDFIDRVSDWDGDPEDARNARPAVQRILEDPAWCPEGQRKG